MEVTPRQVMQYIKLNMREPVFKANSTWFCLTCSACSARCPREIEIPSVMEAVRHMAITAKIFPDSEKVDEIRKFHDIFIDMVKKYGRSYELRLMAEFNIRTSNFFKDVALAPKAIFKGKIGLRPDKTKNMRAIDKLFEIAKQLEEESSKFVPKEKSH
jgi:heterodisulfide reductase subunit C